MRQLLDRLFSMPRVRMPRLPLPRRAASPILTGIADSYRAVFVEGILQGFTLGLAVATAIIVGLVLSRRKGDRS